MRRTGDGAVRVSMDFSPTPIAVLDRGVRLLSRNPWRVPLTAFVLGAIPILASLSTSGIWLHAARDQANLFRLSLSALSLVCTMLAYVIAFRCRLDEADGIARTVPAVLWKGTKLFVRACWLTLPLTLLNLWLMSQAVWALFIVSLATGFFHASFAFDGLSLKAAASATVKVFRRAAPSVILNGVLMIGVQILASKGYSAAQHALYARIGLTYPVFWFVSGSAYVTLYTTLLSAWGAAFYVGQRDVIGHRPTHIADVFS